MNITPKPDTARLVMVGGWNANILLNADWLSKYLFPGQPELQFDWPKAPTYSGPPRVSTREVRIALAGPKLSLTPLETSDDDEVLVELAVKLADYLPHTPVTALGINFAFGARVDLVCANRCFDGTPSSIKNILCKFGAVTEETFRFALQSGESVLNLAITQDAQGQMAFDFNFHHEMDSLAKFKELIADHPIAEYRFKTDAILNAIAGICDHEDEKPDAKQ